MDLYYTNFVQADLKVGDNWIPVILHHEWAIDYRGVAYKLDNISDEDIQEHNWIELEEKSGINKPID